MNVVKENPRIMETLMSDAIAFGGGAVVSNIALESITAGYMKTQTDAGKTAEELRNLGYMLGVGKIVGGIITQLVAMRYINSIWAKKLFYGIATGFYVSASSDIITAYASTTA